MEKRVNTLVCFCLFLMLFAPFSSSILDEPSCHGSSIPSSEGASPIAQLAPVPATNITLSMFSIEPDGAYQVNPYKTYTSEPAPMGIADYGISSNGSSLYAYQYSTSSFVGIVTDNNLTTSDAHGDPDMAIQLNVNLAFTSNGKQYVYWIQNVAFFDTSIGNIEFLNNIWNFSAPSAPLSQSGVNGNGKVYASGGHSYYYYKAPLTLPGNDIDLSYPSTFTLNVTCGLNVGGQPTVGFGYSDAYGTVTYDTVAFPTSHPVTSFNGFWVNGYNYNPWGSFYDSELVLGGPGNGYNTTLLNSGIQLQLEYWNGHNYQMVTNAFNFGSDTAEGISNVYLQPYAVPSTGMIVIHAEPEPGSTGTLYYQRNIGIIDFKSLAPSGTLYVTTAGHQNAVPWQIPFNNSEVTITVAPGYTYNLQFYQNGVLLESVNCAVSYNQILSAQMMSITLLPADASTSLGSTNYFAISYVLDGQPESAHAQDGTLILSADSGSNVEVSALSSGSGSSEEWALNSQNTFVTIPSGSIATFYYYDLLIQQVAYVLNGSGNISPTLTYYTAPTSASSQFNPAFNSMLIPYSSQQTIWVLKGTTVSVTNNISGSSQDQWATPTSSWSISQANQIHADIIYYHQYQVTASYATPDNSVPSSAPLLSGTQFGSSYQLPLSTTTQTAWLDENTPWEIASTVIAPSGTEQWICPTGTSGTVTQATTINPTYAHQYYLTVISPAPANIATSGSGWYNAGSTAYAGLSSRTVSYGTGAQWAFAGWSTGGNNYQQSNAITMNSAATATAAWTLQYYLTVTSAYGSPSGSGWYNSGNTAYASLNSQIVPGGADTQYTFSSWSTGSTNYQQSDAVTMNSAVTVTANWSTQYYLAVASAYGSPSGSGWYNAGTVANFGVTSPISVSQGEQYAFATWIGSGSGSFSGIGASGSCQVNSPITESATWNTQYYLTVTSPYGSPSGSGWYNTGTTASFGVTTSSSGGTGTQYILSSWSGQGAGSYGGSAASNSVTMSNPITESASWTTQYYLTVNSGGYGSVTGSGWYNSGSSTQAAVQSTIVSGGAGIQHVFSGWTGGASGSGSTSNTITMNSPVTATATWTTQYQLTFAVTPSGSGSTTPTDSNLWVDSGALSITASANSGYTFSQWTANTSAITFSSSSVAATTANVNGPGTITASMVSTPTPTPTTQQTQTATPSQQTQAPTPTPRSTRQPSSTPSTSPKPSSSSPTPSTTPILFPPGNGVPEFPSVTLLAALMALSILVAAVLEIQKRVKK